MTDTYPARIVCLTEETTETLYLLGEERRIVGISGFTVRPPRARREKPKVSAFTSAKIDRIVELKPDLGARLFPTCRPTSPPN
jgi:iron complex transport system substrate-binding protein